METSLKVTRNQLQYLLQQFDWKTSPNQNNTLLGISNLNNVREIINNVESLNLFDAIINNLKASAIFTSASDSMNIQASEGNNIVTQLTLLKTLIQNFLSALLKAVPEEDVNSINIKLPPINDFDELSKISRELHISLTQVILNEEINGQTKIVSVENGSIWFNVFVGTTAVGVVASLVWSAAVIYKKILEGKLLEQQLRGLKAKNDSIEDILTNQKALTQLMIQAEAEYINTEHFKNNAPENIERIKNSIAILADLISKGAEIHPALVAPENVSNLFPNPKNLIGVESKIKKLTGSGSN